ncbi:YaiO family outer membrane beta-barrel protein [Salinimicrobium soli]|uniref:YaiO family outer membrane beta-barrel protein n=1 Tax=Salinimicrobium soli TaxID=1254399 RepID=UPI003AB10233
MSRIALLLVSILFTSALWSQEDPDLLYMEALEAYQKSHFEESLKLTRQGLELAPEYHDIRILQIRNQWALNMWTAADKDLDYLLETAPSYVDVKPLALQRIGRFASSEEALAFTKELLQIYPSDVTLKVREAELLLETGNAGAARKAANELSGREDISGKDRYALQLILKQTVTDEIGVSYQVVSFSKEYSRQDPWHSISTEYQHNFKRTAVLGRVNYTDRGYDNGTLFEMEAYPVFNDHFYSFVNIGLSDNSFFPDFRGSASLFYSFAKNFEAEAGARVLNYGERSYFSAVAGLTAYTGKFYFNLRSFIGPERKEKLVQNYQFNTRYYFSGADNYFFTRLGKGISPDELVLVKQVEENPSLEAWYGNIGLNKAFGIHHVFKASAGMLYEDITSSRTGTQFIGSVGYRYRF